MKQKEASIIFSIFAIFLLSISFASASWFSDIFNKNRVVIGTGDASCTLSSCPKGTSSPSTPITSGLPSVLPTPTCTGTSSFSKCPVTGTGSTSGAAGAASAAIGMVGNFLCSSVSPYKDYCKVVSGKCVKKSCSEVPLSSCNGSFGCSTTSVKKSVPVYGHSTYVEAWVPVSQAKLGLIWCGGGNVGDHGFLCGGSTCGTVNYLTGYMPGCEGATITAVIK